MIQHANDRPERIQESCDSDHQTLQTSIGRYVRKRLRMRGGPAYWTCKRICDVFVSLVMLIVLSPLYLVISLLIALTSEGPVIYRHQRIGKAGRVINVLKFRTMVKDAEECIAFFTPEQKREWEDKFKLEDDPRITSIGRLLRKSSLDELPQLVNVLRGEMSLVGPRPVVAAELEKYGANKDRFLSVTPGLTGYWQAYARSGCDYCRRMRMELEYVDHANLLWDMQILLATCKTVLQGKGAR